MQLVLEACGRSVPGLQIVAAHIRLLSLPLQHVVLLIDTVLFSKGKK